MTNKAATVWAIAAVGVGFTLLALDIYLNPPKPQDFAQGTNAMEVEYKSCKAQAPEGFDCVMVPMMVSKEFLEKQK